jgi:hypothetical protein
MRWIILSDNPKKLQVLLDSAGDGLPHTTPQVLIYAQPPLEGYASIQGVCRLLVSKSLASDTETIVGWTQLNGTLEPMTLITTDDMVFSSRVNLQDAWYAMNNHSIAGLSLTHSPESKGLKLSEGHFLRGGAPCYTWDWDQWFSFGTIYRTGDLLGPICRAQWNSPSELLTALNSDVALRRRNRMACLSISPLSYQKEE